MTASTTTSRDLMTRMYESAAKADYDDVFACLSEDLVVNEPPFLPYGDIYRGHDGFRNLIGKVTQVLDVAQMQVIRMVAEGDRAIGIIEMPDIATGEQILLAEESLIHDGKVVEITVYFHEPRTLLGQLNRR
jgi:ketosteroid isomerase-like protein